MPGSLAAVIPVFNQRDEIGSTLSALDRAIAATGFDAEIVVVDDGSIDGSGDAARAWSGRTPLRVVQQSNAGRFAARLAGIDASDAAYCLLIDSRVEIGHESLAFVEAQLPGGPDKEVWNAHVEIASGRNPYGVFWDVLTSAAFRAYFRAPTTTSFGLEDFERFPKGTTCFFAPRMLLREAFASFRTRYRDPRNANDDTPVIRWVAARRQINISPDFRCLYIPRQRLLPFLRHAFHRGVVFLDGHGRRESRFFPIIVVFYPASIAWVVASVRLPLLVAAPFGLGAVVGASLAFAQRRYAATATMAWVTPLYGAAHGAGMWRGLALAVATRFGRSRR